MTREAKETKWLDYDDFCKDIIEENQKTLNELKLFSRSEEDD